MPAAAADAWSSAACVRRSQSGIPGPSLPTVSTGWPQSSIIRSKSMPAAVSSCRRWTTGAGDLSHGWYPDDHATIHPNGKFNFQGDSEPTGAPCTAMVATGGRSSLAQLHPIRGPIGPNLPTIWPHSSLFPPQSLAQAGQFYPFLGPNLDQCSPNGKVNHCPAPKARTKRRHHGNDLTSGMDGTWRCSTTFGDGPGWSCPWSNMTATATDT